MTGVALRAHDLVVRRSDRSGSFELRVESLALAMGEVTALLGHNGAGKSTLLRALAGLERPTSGRIERSTDGPVTLVFQRPIVFAGSVAHNLRAALSGARLTRDDAALRIREALERFDIAALAERNAATLSGGETRRLTLARAFVIRPDVLLLDEPFDDLDASGQESLSLDLRRAIAETNVAVGVVTHDLRRALLLADRVAILEHGRVVQSGTTEEVLNRPVNPDVARLVGMSNLVAGTIGESAGEGRSWCEVGGGRRLPVRAQDAPAGAVWVGIRPEHLHVEACEGGIPIGEGRVVHVVSDGVATTVTFDWAGRELRTHLIAGRGIARLLSPGDTRALSVHPENTHLMVRTQPGD